ncbi:hypothetical protein MVES1_003088 [Malassezia vespertilionis]|uniref:uncharacterized protein n=1 Tax=Malassezia vespertilionis TaxID=2020962 RepID=UPI0024B0F939|nr:uncharacterized protein MVES1_003088 [Malassezia vespertilionis]WFD07718.1 hypothetical protein MVES1_003088 [Malassezia vespertilionis]
MAQVWKMLSRVFRVGHARYLVGRDLANNAYYELPSLSGSQDPRHTRRAAPSIEELVKDVERQQLVLHNAHILETRERARQAEKELQREHQHALAIEAQKQQAQQRDLLRAQQDLELAAQSTQAPDTTIHATTVQPQRRGE